MFRSQGELLDYAHRVFSLFAEDTSIDNHRGLSRVGVECAIYTLLGFKPSSPLLSLPHSRYDGLIAEEHPQVRSLEPFVTEEAFKRFALICADECGAVLAPEDTFRLQLSSNVVTGTKGGLGDDSAWSAPAWLLFDSLAGPKGYVTLDDFLTADKSPLFSEFISHRNSDVRSLSDLDVRRRHTLLENVFFFLDADHDGRLMFADMRSCLSSC